MAAVSLPVLCAGLFLALSVFAWTQDQASPERQARKRVEKIYTVNRMQDLTALYEKGLPALYEENYESGFTEAGNRALSATGLPYVLLFREFSAPVERTCVTELELEELPLAGQSAGEPESLAGQSAGEPESGKAEGKKTVCYTYRARVDFHLEKGLEALAPVETVVYDGTVSMKKNGLLRWSLDDITIK